MFFPTNTQSFFLHPSESGKYLLDKTIYKCTCWCWWCYGRWHLQCRGVWNRWTSNIFLKDQTTLLDHHTTSTVEQLLPCNIVKLGSRSKVYLKSLIRDLDLELVAIIAMSPTQPPPPPWNFSEQNNIEISSYINWLVIWDPSAGGRRS